MDQTVINATTDYYQRQNESLLELIQNKDALIARLQDESEKKTQAIFAARNDNSNLVNSVKEYVIECLNEREFTQEVAENFANICDFELTKTVTITATVDFEIEVEVPFDVDSDDIAHTIDFSADSYEYSITDFSLDVQSLQSSDNF